MRWLTLAVAGLTTTIALAAPSGITGNWAATDGSVIRVAPCGAEVCLTVLKLPPAAPVATDTMNPDKSLRSRPLCGLRIGAGFKTEGQNAASGGSLYDPKSGKTYNGKIELKGDSLKLRGYVGVPMFGRTEVWSRAGEVGVCHS